MIEFDEHGNEWFGYSFGGDEDPAEAVDRFTGNVHYVEWLSEQVHELKGMRLRCKFEKMFASLPERCRVAITDDPLSLFAEVVRVRNRYAHGKFDTPAPSTLRLNTMTTKLAALLMMYEAVLEGRTETAIIYASTQNPFLREVLSRTDAPVEGAMTGGTQ